MVQKKAFALILGRSYTSYEAALLNLKQERLDTRRQTLSHKFALKCTQSSKHSHMFPPNPNFRANKTFPRIQLSHLRVLQQPYP